MDRLPGLFAARLWWLNCAGSGHTQVQGGSDGGLQAWNAAKNVPLKPAKPRKTRRRSRRLLYTQSPTQPIPTKLVEAADISSPASKTQAPGKLLDAAGPATLQCVRASRVSEDFLSSA